MFADAADPVVLEARELYREITRTRRAILADAAVQGGDSAREHLRTRLSGASARDLDRVADELHASHTASDAHAAALVTALAELTRRLTNLLRMPQQREIVDRALTHRARALRAAVLIDAERRRTAAFRSRAAAMPARAAAANRALTAWEARQSAALIAAAEDELTMGHSILPPELTQRDLRDDAFDALATLELRRARAELRTGLLETEQMREIIAEALPALGRGEPMLLVGETGGAKTALAEHLSTRHLGLTPELISGYADITSAQVIGTTELRVTDGATETAFAHGPLLRAMKEGRPVILDEINAMPAEFLKRLNRILQLRPGDMFHAQENAGRPVRIAPGFTILATANEQTPHRYRGLDRLSAELLNRFGANTYRVHYPDAGLAYTEFPRENALLATAAAIDQYGELPPHLSEDELTRAARAAFISQQIFTGAHGNGFGEYVSAERQLDGRPGLEESVLAPRTLVSIVQKVSGSAGAVSLELALRRFVEGLFHPEDRQVLTLILEGQGFRVGA